MRTDSPSRSTIAVVAAAVLVISACGSASPAEERRARAERGTGDVVIAVPWPWESRKPLRYGEGLQMATDEVNAAGGVNGRKVRLARFDDRESVDEGRLVAQRIAADPDIVAVIGHLQSYVTVPAAAIYDLAGLVLVSPTATDSELTSNGYTHVFRTTFTDKVVGRQLADFAHGRGFRRVAIFYVRNRYGREVANSFEERANELAVAIVARKSYEPGDQTSDRTFRPTVDEWTHLKLDAIFLAGEVPAGATFVATARQAGLTVPVIGGDAMSSPELMSVAGAASEGLIVGSFFHPDEPRPEVRKFRAEFSKRYGAVPDAGAAVGYDAVSLIVHAMRQAGSTLPGQVAVALRGVNGWQGVTGTFTFDKSGESVGKSLPTLLVRNGRFEYLGEASAPPTSTLASR